MPTNRAAGFSSAKKGREALLKGNDQNTAGHKRYAMQDGQESEFIFYTFRCVHD